MNKILCLNCDEQLFPLDESKNFPDATYTETCPYCFGEYSYRVEGGKAYPWEPPKRMNQEYKGKGKPGGSE